MPEVSADNSDSAYDLHQAILQHATWREDIPTSAGSRVPGYACIDGDVIARQELHPLVLKRLNVSLTSYRGDYSVSFGRKIDGHSSLSDLYDDWTEYKKRQAHAIYQDMGERVAFMCVVREGGSMHRAAYYYINTAEPKVPDEPPVCSIEVDIEGRVSLRSATTSAQQGSLIDVAKALHINPATGEPYAYAPRKQSNQEFRAKLAAQIPQPPTQAEIEAFRQNDQNGNASSTAETRLQPVTTEEILALTALAKRIHTMVIE